MKIRIFMFLVLGISVAGICFSQSDPSHNSETNAEINMNSILNTDTNAGVTTSMNGNTSTASGGSISSTAASSESRKTSGSS